MIIDPSKKLFKWGPIDFKLLYESCFMEVVLNDIKKYYTWPWPASIVIYQQGRGLWVNEEKLLQQVGLKYFNKYILNKVQFEKHWQKYQDWIKKFELIRGEIDTINLSDLTNKNMAILLKKFYKLNIGFWTIVHVPEIANWGGEYLLKKELNKVDKVSSDKNLEILSAPIKYSFFQQEELDLIAIGIIANKKKIKEALEKHANKYHWLLNSYGGNQILTADYFDRKLKELLIEKSVAEIIKSIKSSILKNKNRKRNLIRQQKFDEKIIRTSEQLSESIWWQDHRKAYIWQMNYYWDLFIKEISRRTDYKFDQLQWCWGKELLDILNASKKLRKKEIIKRQRYYLLLGNKGRLQKITDIKIIKKYIKTFWPEDKINIKKFKGVVVSKGSAKIVKSQVKIIRNPFKDNKKMKAGDILVASMTSPEYIVAMRKAKAIITDEGGMTSHAAIVSRELGIACVVGTKVATRALEDRDLVEIDSIKGIVKKLN